MTQLSGLINAEQQAAAADRPAKFPNWLEYDCIGDNGLVKVGNETYYKSGDGKLMPTRRDQPPPDLRYFKQVQK